LRNLRQAEFLYILNYITRRISHMPSTGWHLAVYSDSIGSERERGHMRSSVGPGSGTQWVSPDAPTAAVEDVQGSLLGWEAPACVHGRRSRAVIDSVVILSSEEQRGPRSAQMAPTKGCDWAFLIAGLLLLAAAALAGMRAGPARG
jgi:hypothetical protein